MHIEDIRAFYDGVNPNDYEANPRVREIWPIFKNSMIGKARQWLSIAHPAAPANQAEFQQVLEDFRQHYSLAGSTPEDRLKAWKQISWEPSRESFDDFLYRFHTLARENNVDRDADKLTQFRACIPYTLHVYCMNANTFLECVQQVQRALVWTNQGATGITPQVGATTAQPFMSLAEKRVSFGKPEVDSGILVKTRSQESDRIEVLTDQLKKLTSTVDMINEAVTKDRDRDRKRNDSRDHSNDRSRNRDRSWGRDRSNSRGRDRRDRSSSRSDNRGARDRDRDRSRDGRFCKYCHKSGHTIGHCWDLKRICKENNLKLEWSEPEQDAVNLIKALQVQLKQNSTN